MNGIMETVQKVMAVDWVKPLAVVGSMAIAAWQGAVWFADLKQENANSRVEMSELKAKADKLADLIASTSKLADLEAQRIDGLADSSRMTREQLNTFAQVLGDIRSDVSFLKAKVDNETRRP